MSSSSTLPPLIELIQTNQVSVPQVQVPETPRYHILPPPHIKAIKIQQKYNNKKYVRSESTSDHTPRCNSGISTLNNNNTNASIIPNSTQATTNKTTSMSSLHTKLKNQVMQNRIKQRKKFNTLKKYQASQSSDFPKPKNTRNVRRRKCKTARKQLLINPNSIPSTAVLQSNLPPTLTIPSKHQQMPISSRMPWLHPSSANFVAHMMPPTLSIPTSHST